MQQPTAEAPSFSAGCRLEDDAGDRYRPSAHGQRVVYRVSQPLSSRLRERISSTENYSNSYFVEYEGHNLADANAMRESLKVSAELVDNATGLSQGITESAVPPRAHGRGRDGWSTNCNNSECRFIDPNTGLLWSLVNQTNFVGAPAICATLDPAPYSARYRVPTLGELLWARDGNIQSLNGGRALGGNTQNIFWSSTISESGDSRWGVRMDIDMAPQSIFIYNSNNLFCVQEL